MDIHLHLICQFLEIRDVCNVSIAFRYVKFYDFIYPRPKLTSMPYIAIGLVKKFPKIELIIPRINFIKYEELLYIKNNIIELDLRGLSDINKKILVHLKDFKKLKKLILKFNNNVKDYHIKDIKLESLVLDCNSSITGNGLNPNIRKLYLENNKLINDDDLKILCNLEHLNINRNNKITDKVLSYFSKLKYLSAINSKNITYEGWKKLKKLKEIHYYGYVEEKSFENLKNIRRYRINSTNTYEILT